MAEMAHTRLAAALKRVNGVARKAVVKSSSIQRADRELLLDRGYLLEICKGWYYLGRPSDKPGDSTAWYATFWDFVAVYLDGRLGRDYCLSAGSSLDLHTGGNLIPSQVTALTARGGTVVLKLPYSTSLVVYLDARN